MILASGITMDHIRLAKRDDTSKRASRKQHFLAKVHIDEALGSHILNTTDEICNRIEPIEHQIYYDREKEFFDIPADNR